VDFGSAKGTVQRVIRRPKSRDTTAESTFEFTPAIRNGVSDAVPVSASIRTGASGERFVYIDIGTYAGQSDSCWSRRLKILLQASCVSVIGAGGIRPRVINVDGHPAYARATPS